ncbi:hypothetical protein GHT06_019993 [Daphnia sinensis]|uniref:Uncharacterized protein n=1 Tax=Daphnia sinensis TaxID=1820382 RepID=A0AAD5PPU6_9CRUS|nr:hypothetical protein GHT06_019993 [Daphnia sinensis]
MSVVTQQINSISPILSCYSTEVNQKMQTARAVVFDIRGEGNNDLSFSFSAEALYEVSLLAHAGSCSNFAFLSVVLMGEKGFELLLEMHSLIELDMSFRRSFGKLKHLLKISNENAIYTSKKPLESILRDQVNQFKEQCGYCIASTQLEIIIITKTDREKILMELETFLAGVECSELNAVVIIHLASAESSVQSETIQEWRPKLVWHALGEDGDVELFFKSWLTCKRKNWNIEIADSNGRCEWTTRIDIEDLVYDLKGWPYRISADRSESNGIGMFDDGNIKTLGIIKWLRSDGVPAWLMHGMPRRLLPASEMAHDEEASKINNEQFFSLSRWLAKETLVALAMLVPAKHVIDYFILTPGSDGSLLMRSIASQELILPSPTCPPVVDPQETESELFTLKEKCFEEIQSAYHQLPAHSFSQTGQSSVVETVEFHTLTNIQMTGTKPKANARGRGKKRQ